MPSQSKKLKSACLSLLIAVGWGVAAAAAPSQAGSQATVTPPATSALQTPLTDELELKRQEMRLKADELKLKVADLEFRKQDAAASRNSERWKTFITLAPAIVALFGVGVPVVLGLRSFSEQRKAALSQSKAQFQMKAVELILQGSPSAEVAKERARALSALFPDWFPEEFAQNFDPKAFRIDAGNSLPRRLELLRLLATANPQNRTQILKDWYVINHRDWWFIDALLTDMQSEDRGHLESAAERTVLNDAWASQHRGKPDWVVAYSGKVTNKP